MTKEAIMARAWLDSKKKQGLIHICPYGEGEVLIDTCKKRIERIKAPHHWNNNPAGRYQWALCQRCDHVQE